MRGASKKRVMISDVAARVGLAKGTVSRALNDYPDISERTKKRVAAAAKAMQYRPLSPAQAIKTGRARAIGLVLDTSEDGTHHPFLTDFLDGLSQAASAENWTLTVATAAHSDGVVRTISRLSDERKADGFILPRTRRVDPRIAHLKAAGVPFVLYGRVDDPDDCAWFDIAGETAMRDAVARLAALGHRRIGFLNYDPSYKLSTLRLEGYRAGMAAAGLTCDPELIASGVVTTADGEAAARPMLLRGTQRPTALVCAVDRAALGVYAAAAKAGLSIGSDLSVIGYDGAIEGALAHPPLTTFAVDLRLAGEKLAQLLMRRIRGADPSELRILAPATFVQRGSDGPPAPPLNHNHL